MSRPNLPRTEDASETQSDSDDRASTVCYYCQQPIEEEVDHEKGRLMHDECAVDQRCGVSLYGPEDEQTDENTGLRSTERSASGICYRCQQPIEKDNSHRFRGEKVHFQCVAELRCGVSLGGADREDERGE